jgi:thiol:disulfide interchange protein DsbD
VSQGPFASFRRLLPLAALLVTLAAALIAPAPAAAQFGAQQPASSGMFRFPAEMTARLDPSVAFPGEVVTIEIALTIDKDYYTYSMVPPPSPGPIPTKPDIRDIDSTPFEYIEGEEWTEPRPIRKFDRAFNMEIGTHVDTILIKRRVRVRADTQPAQFQISGGLTVQLCDAVSCLPPRRLPFTLDLLVRERAPEDAPRVPYRVVDMPPADPTPAPPVAAVEPIPTATPTPAPPVEPESTPTPEQAATVADTTPIDQAAAQLSATPTAGVFGGDRLIAGGGSIWAVIVASFFAGIFAIFMPCVFPMIPITIAYFTKNAQDSTFKRVKLCSIFSLAIVAGFALFGFGLAMVLYAAGRGAESAGFITQIAANPWLNTILALLFVAFALSLFGLFEIALPSSIANKLQSAKGGRGDWLGAILMAAIFVVVSFTCTVPIIGLLLPTIFTGSWYTPLVGMTVFAAAFALPFFFLGLVPQALTSLPRSGDWLNATKITMGLIEVAAALYYISKADMIWGWGFFTRELVFAGWAAIAIITALYLLKVITLAHDTAAPVGPMRLVTAITFATLGVYFASGAFGKPLFADLESLMPQQRLAAFTSVASSGEKSGGSIKEQFIVNDLERAQALSRETGKPLFIDFTGWTCTNCRLMELDMFPRPAVRERLEQFVLVALYTDDPIHGERFQKYQIEEFGTLSLPYYVAVTPEGEKIATFGGLTRNESDFVEFLDFALKGGSPQLAMAETK